MYIFNKEEEKRYLNYKSSHPKLSWEEAITYINIGLDHEFYDCVCQITKPNDITVLVNKYRQLPEDYIPVDLENIPLEYVMGELKLRHEACFAFETMCQAASEEEVYLQAVSAFRSFTYQNQVYYKNLTPDIMPEDYCSVRDKVSARAGHSEHQTGLAVDINELEETFENTKEFNWLIKNSRCYGFILRYPKGKEAITGYQYEPWHFRYLGIPLAAEIYLSGLTYDEYYVRYHPC